VKSCGFTNDIIHNYGDNGISIIATDSLTNQANAIVERPGFRNKIHEIDSIGGAFSLASNIRGNVTRYAEFNFYCDAEAVKIVPDPKLDLEDKIVGADVTRSPKYKIIPKPLKNAVNNDTHMSRFITTLLEQSETKKRIGMAKKKVEVFSNPY
jgi:inosine-uridine nucleoside N-ribohydrolase